MLKMTTKFNGKYGFFNAGNLIKKSIFSKNPREDFKMELGTF